MPFNATSRRIGAVARHTILAAMRSRLVAVLAMLLGAATICLPLLVEGDGTPDGDIRVAVRYALGAAIGILSLATLWTSCGAVSIDAASKRLALTRVKPLRPFELWLGKWLGIILLDAALLAAAGAATHLTLAIRSHRHAAATWSVTRVRHPPIMPTVREEAEMLLRNYPPPPDVDPAVALRKFIEQVPERYRAISAGETVPWDFALERPLPRDATLWLRMNFTADRVSRQEVTADCVLNGDNGSSTSFHIDDFTSSEFTIPVDASKLAGSTSIRLDFTYAPTMSDAGSLLVQPRRGIALLEPCGGFTGNLIRALLVELSILATLAALGVTFGMLFTFPVAAFCATGLLLSVFASAYAMEEAIEPDEPPETIGARIAQETAIVVTSAAKPLLDPHPLELLADGERVPSGELFASVGCNLVLTPLLLAAVGAFAFSRKET